MQNNGTVVKHVLKLHGHRFEGSIEHARIVDIIPRVKQIIRAFKLRELVTPKVASSLIQKVNEC